MGELSLIGQWVTRERKARHWTQDQLAARAGVSRAAVYNVESGNGTHVISVLSVVGALDGCVSIRRACMELHAQRA